VIIITEIIYIDVFSAAKICSAISFVAGIIISFIVTIPAAIYGLETIFTNYSAISGGDVFISVMFDIILLTVIITISGCITGTVISYIYNMTSPFFGGLEIGLLDEEVYIEENPEENPIGYE
jgi:predicted anti-sigma-YlaC factor YlaD